MKDDVLDPSVRAGGSRAAVRRGRRRLAVAALVVALALVAWALWHRAASRPPPRRLPPSVVAALAQLRRGFVSSLGVERGRLSAVAPVAVTDGSANGAIAVCGVPGGLSVDEAADAASVADTDPASEPASTADVPAADTPTAPAPAMLPSLPPPTAAEQRIFDAMARSPDALARAAVLVLAPSGDPDDPAARIARLAETALHTSDPRVYSLAYRTCRGVSAVSQPTACGSLSVAQWARLDGGNGVPWLYALHDAVRRGDMAAADDALFQVAAAERFDDRYADVGAAAVGELPANDDEATLAAWLLTARAMSGAMPPAQALLDRCSAAATGDANRRQLCVAAAEKLVDRGNSALLASIGASLDHLVTGSAVRADRLRAERDALFASAAPTDFSCDGLRRNLHRFQRSAEIGELAAWREARDAASLATAVRVNSAQSSPQR